MGTAYTTLEELKNGTKSLKAKSSTINILNFKVQKSVNFLEYVFGGCEINLSIAIDFTLSNGDPNGSTSLHALNNPNNQYKQAIQACGNILQYYDSDKEIPAYGFGASINN